MTVAIGLTNPKFARNVAAVIRSASCYEVPTVLWSGRRVTDELAKASRLPREERMKGYANVQTTITNRMFDHTRGLIPVAIELVPGAECLIEFEHPENAFYVFGPEDGSLSRADLGQCYKFVKIPTAHCLNLATAVSTVLYDRHAKRVARGLEVPYGGVNGYHGEEAVG